MLNILTINLSKNCILIDVVIVLISYKEGNYMTTDKNDN